MGFNSMASDSISQARLLSELGRSLREVYGEVEAQPVPEQFVVFLERMEERERALTRED